MQESSTSFGMKLSYARAAAVSVEEEDAPRLSSFADFDLLLRVERPEPSEELLLLEEIVEIDPTEQLSFDFQEEVVEAAEELALHTLTERSFLSDSKI